MPIPAAAYRGIVPFGGPCSATVLPMGAVRRTRRFVAAAKLPVGSDQCVSGDKLMQGTATLPSARHCPPIFGNLGLAAAGLSSTPTVVPAQPYFDARICDHKACFLDEKQRLVTFLPVAAARHQPRQPRSGEEAHKPRRSRVTGRKAGRKPHDLVMPGRRG